MIATRARLSFSRGLHTSAVTCGRRYNYHREGGEEEPRKPPGGPAGAHLRRAKLFAAGVRQLKPAEAPVAGPSNLSPSTLASASQELRARRSSGGPEPALEDLLRLQPERTPRPKAEKYPARHAELADAISNAFLSRQLVALAREMGLEVAYGERKAELVQRIMDTWGWVKPVIVDTREWTKHIEVSPAELFLLQHDPTVSQALSELHGVSLNVVDKAEETGYLLEAKRPRFMLDDLDRFLHTHRQGHATVRWAVSDMAGVEPTKATLWAIAQTTGAYVDKVEGSRGKDEWAASALSRDAAEAAKRIMLAIARRAAMPSPKLFAVGEGEVGLSPHVPATNSPLPWYAEAAMAGRSLFRLSGTTSSDPLESTPALSLTKGETVELGSILQDLSARLSSSTVSFQFGHLLTPSKDGALDSPIAGSWPIPDRQWSSLSGTIFSPAVPPTLIHSPLPSPKRVRRVTYAPPNCSKRLVAEYTYPAPASEPSIGTSSDEPSWVHRLDEMIQTSNDEIAFDRAGLDVLIGKSESEAPANEPLVVRASLRQAEAVDVLLPSRPVDARVSANSSQEAIVPDALDEFFGKIHEHAASARMVALTDLKWLRAGYAPPQPAESELDYEEDFFFTDDRPLSMGRELDEETPEPTAPQPRPSQPEPMVTEEILPPLTLRIDSETYTLESDEVREVAERPEGGVTLRTVASADLTGTGGVVRYAELEGDVNGDLWRALGEVTKPVAPVERRSW